MAEWYLKQLHSILINGYYNYVCSLSSWMFCYETWIAVAIVPRGSVPAWPDWVKKTRLLGMSFVGHPCKQIN